MCQQRALSICACALAQSLLGDPHSLRTCKDVTFTSLLWAHRILVLLIISNGLVLAVGGFLHCPAPPLGCLGQHWDPTTRPDHTALAMLGQQQRPVGYRNPANGPALGTVRCRRRPPSHVVVPWPKPPCTCRPPLLVMAQRDSNGALGPSFSAATSSPCLSL
jgi:hypothetical protein